METMTVRRSTDTVKARAKQLFAEHLAAIHRRTDRLFAWLMLCQWLASIAAALWITPQTWAGRYSQVHIHVYAAIFLGGLITLLPVALAWLQPGRVLTRHVIAGSQMLMSALLIHLTGGRIETHFHVFGSLAFLAFYRDWRVFLPATAIVAADHFIRGVYWPQSVFGVLTASPWRWVEHAGWVAFEDLFLIRSCFQSVKEMMDIASQRAELEATNETIEQKVIERTAELRASEARKGAIMESALDCIIAIDQSGCITDFNPAAERTFGYKRDEVLGKDLADLIIPPAFRAAHRRGMERFIKTGETRVLGKRIEVTAMRADGTEFPAELATSYVTRQESMIFTAYLRDLSDRKQTEERLRILSSAVDQRPVSILITDLRGAIEYVNTALTESTGYTLDDLKGQTPGILFAGDTPADVFRDINTSLEAGSWRGVIRSRKKSGELFWESVSIQSIKDASGQHTHRVAMAEDITRRLQMEQKIAQLAQIVESAEAAIVSHDLSGSVLTWNRGAERMYGYSSDEMIGRTITALVPGDRLDENQAITEKLSRGQGVSHLETARVTKSGDVIPVLLTTSPIQDHDGAVLAVAHVAWDLTQIKRLEQQLAQAQKLESIGQLAAGIAHEINTPIQYIGDNAHFLKNAFDDLLQVAEAGEPEPVGIEATRRDLVATVPQVDSEVLTYLKDEVPRAIGHLIEGVDQVARIVRAMKEFSHPGPVEKTYIDINRAIESTVVVSRNEWKYVAEVKTNLDPDLPPVPCVAGEFNQVILNLIVNAAHAIADKVNGSGQMGSILVSTSVRDGFAEIRVSDSGGGIPESIRSKIFDPFFTTKPVGKGTGQGLAIAHSVIVQRHHGTLRFESEPGQGTTFVIQLPLACEAEAEPVSAL